MLLNFCMSTFVLSMFIGNGIRVTAYYVPILPTKATTIRTIREQSSLYSVEEKRFSGSDGTGVGWIDPSAPVNSKAALQKTIQKSLEGMNFQKHISLLGSTGSIGTQTLEIIDACPNNFVIDALSAGTNVELLSQQIMKYTPKIASVATSDAAIALKERLVALQCTNIPDIVFGEDGIIAAATIASADTVVTGIVGAAGLQPTIEAIKCGKDIALANKETLISGGPVINPLVEKYGVNMVCLSYFLFFTQFDERITKTDVQ
jgi:1-deoxy-D-xylulose-5-phosphate reductoisomerase